MNIFVLSSNPQQAARYHCDKHVVKMILESAQMLSTAHRVLDGDENVDPILYKTTHKNHPCSVWVRESVDNYYWLYDLFVALCNEYHYRYDRTHMTEVKLRDRLRKEPNNIPFVVGTRFPIAMKSEPQCIQENNPVQSYRDFYKTKQSRFNMNWTKRETPEWFKENNYANV